MAYSRTTYFCDVCHGEHRSYHAAERCETQHIVDKAISGLRTDIADIFAKPSSKAPPHDR